MTDNLPVSGNLLAPVHPGLEIGAIVKYITNFENNVGASRVPAMILRIRNYQNGDVDLLVTEPLHYENDGTPIVKTYPLGRVPYWGHSIPNAKAPETVLGTWHFSDEETKIIPNGE